MQEDNNNDDKTDAQSEHVHITDLPKVQVEVDVEVPKEIWEIAEGRLEQGREKFNTNATLDDYLLDHITFVHNYEKVAERSDE